MVQKIFLFRGKVSVTTGSLGHAGRVIFTLIKGYLDKDYELYTDNF